ncbi:MAG: hypothetical protein H0T73_04905 [Ardenticatenales bacterium]|nr:hypothetical protein [Ardenticatenales bacterium]
MARRRYQVDPLRLAVLLVVGVLFVVGGFVLAAPGDLDPSFGTNGKVITEFDQYVLFSALALQPDGKILVVGCYQVQDEYYITLARYISDGNLDSTFGEGGKVLFPSPNALLGCASAVVLQPDGHIVVAGTRDEGTDWRGILLRYAPDGSLDESFGVAGLVKNNEGTSWRTAAVQSDGSIVAAGGMELGYQSVFTVSRYDTMGQPDVTFGVNGMVTTTIGNDEDASAINALLIQPDGKIVVGGNTENFQEGYSDIAVARYMPSGELDTSFDIDGIVVADRDEHDYLSDLALDNSNRILIAGGSYYNAGRAGDVSLGVLLGRLMPDGEFDGFGTGLWAERYTEPMLWGISDIALQADGKIVAVGPSNVWTGYPLSGQHGDFIVARYTESGFLDQSFGTAGVAAPYFTPLDDSAQAVAIQPDGRIVVAGRADGDFALARYRVDQGSPTRHLYLPVLHQPLP